MVVTYIGGLSYNRLANSSTRWGPPGSQVACYSDTWTYIGSEWFLSVEARRLPMGDETYLRRAFEASRRGAYWFPFFIYWNSWWPALSMMMTD